MPKVLAYPAFIPGPHHPYTQIGHQSEALVPDRTMLWEGNLYRGLLALFFSSFLGDKPSSCPGRRTEKSELPVACSRNGDFLSKTPSTLKIMGGGLPKSLVPYLPMINIFLPNFFLSTASPHFPNGLVSVTRSLTQLPQFPSFHIKHKSQLGPGAF